MTHQNDAEVSKKLLLFQICR